MATRNQTQGGASAPSNVVRLPTAAPRQVKQPCNKAARAERARLREGMPFDYILPGVRAAATEAELLKDVRHTPGLVMVMAILDALPEDVRVMAREKLAKAALSGSRSALAAFAVTKQRTYGQMNDLHVAMRLLDEGRL